MTVADPRHILVINVNWLGDVIFSLPAYRALKARYPLARVSAMCAPRVADVLRGCPWVDDVFEFDEKGRERSLRARLDAVRQLRSRGIDAAFFIHSSLTRRILVWMAGIPRRVGYNSKDGGRFLTESYPSPDPDTTHRSDMYVGLFASAGISIEDNRCQMQINPSALSKARQLLARHGVPSDQPFVVVNTGGNWDLKRWSKERFAELVRRLSADYGRSVVIPGAANDVALARDIALTSGVHPVVLAGQTGLPELAAVMSLAECVISNDSGPMHLAAAVGANVVAIFGPTRPEITAPRGVGGHRVLFKEMGCNKSACYYLECSDNQCMMSVTVDEVLKAYEEFRRT